MLEITARLLPNVSVKSVGQVQIIDYLPVWRVQFSFLGNYQDTMILAVGTDFLLVGFQTPPLTPACFTLTSSFAFLLRAQIERP